MSLQRPVSERPIEVNLGRSWLDERELIASISQRGDDPIEHIVDVIDFVVDGRNLTARLCRDALVDFTRELLTAMAHVLAGRKGIVSFREEPWELALVPRDHKTTAISVYSLGASSELVTRNLQVDTRLLRAEVIACTQILCQTMANVDERLGMHPRVHALRKAAAALEPIGGPTAHPGANPPREQVLTAVGDGITAYLGFDADDIDLLVYDAQHAFDRHALLVRGRLALEVESHGQESSDPGSARVFELHSGDGVLVTIDRLVGYLRRALARRRTDTVSTIHIGAVQVAMRGAAFTVSTGEDSLNLPVAQLIPLLGTLVTQFGEWLQEHAPRQIENQRWCHLADSAASLEKWLADLQRGDELHADPASLASEFATSRQDDIEPELDVDFPYPIDLNRLKLLNCEVVWAWEHDDVLFSDVSMFPGHVLIEAPDQIVVLDLATGGQRWSHDAEDVVESHVINAAQRAALLCGEDHSTLVDAATGSERWRTHVFGAAAWVERPVRTVARGQEQALLVAGADRQLHAVELANGQPLWSFGFDHGDWGALEVGGPVVVIATDDGLLQALHVWSGKALWRVATRGERVLHTRVSGETLFAVFQDDHGHCQLRTYDLLTGRCDRVVALGRDDVVWVRSMADQMVIGSMTDRGVRWRAFDADATESWSLQLPGAADATPLEVYGTSRSSHVWAIDDRGTVCAVDTRAGALMWTRCVTNVGSPAVVGQLQRAGDVLLVTQGAVYVVDAMTGEPLCAVGGLHEDPGLVQVTPGFDLLVGETLDDDRTRIALHRAGHFIAVIK